MKASRTKESKHLQSLTRVKRHWPNFVVFFGLLVAFALPVGSLSKSIPVDDFFRESAATNFSLSPDGEYIALIGRDPKGKRNLYARNLDIGNTQAWTIEGGGNSVTNYAWISNERLAYRVSRHDYYFRGLYSVERDKERIHQLDLGAVDTIVDPLIDRESLLVLRRRGDGEITQYRTELVEIDSMTGFPIETVWTFKGVPLAVETDLKGQVRLLKTYYKGEYYFMYRADSEEPWTRLSLPETVNVLGFGPGGKVVLVSDYFGRDRSALYRYDMDRQKLGDLIYEDPVYDLHESVVYMLDVDRKVPLGIRYQADREKTIWFSPEMQQVQKIIDDHNPDTINRVVSANLSVGRFLVRCYSDRQPSIYRLLDYGKRRIIDLWPTRPQIIPEMMAPVESIEFVSRDGLRLHGYLTRPIIGKPPFPTVVVVHGGPWARDTWGFDAEVQFLASRGYAVLQVNYRGSTGFGRRISLELKADLKGMNDDIEDAVRWAVAKGHTDNDRVGIMGGSFGGYAALYGVAFKPDLYKCAIGNVGVYDWPMHVDEKKGDFSNYIFDYLTKLWGENYREKLEAVSPYFYVDQIVAPVFIAYGREDTRVKPAQSKRMINALKKHGVKHEVFSKSWEGHGFYDDEIQFEYYRKVEAFLGKNL